MILKELTLGIDSGSAIMDSPQHFSIHAILHISNATYGIGIWLAFVSTHEFCYLLRPCKTSLWSLHSPQGNKLQRSSRETTSSGIKTTSKFRLRVIVGLCPTSSKVVFMACRGVGDGLCVWKEASNAAKCNLCRGLQLTTV